MELRTILKLKEVGTHELGHQSNSKQMQRMKLCMRGGILKIKCYLMLRLV